MEIEEVESIQMVGKKCCIGNIRWEDVVVFGFSFSVERKERKGKECEFIPRNGIKRKEKR